MSVRFENYRVRVAVDVSDDGSECFLREEWYHDPEPDYVGLDLHRDFHPAVTVFDPKTGRVAYTEFYDMGNLEATVYDDPNFKGHKLPTSDNE